MTPNIRIYTSQGGPIVSAYCGRRYAVEIGELLAPVHLLSVAITTF